jgi:hypothetical protein
MWVFIRPGVVRSANEMKGKLVEQLCPIHRFDGNHQFQGLLQKGGVALEALCRVASGIA